jgi:hypothetical protein
MTYSRGHSSVTWGFTRKFHPGMSGPTTPRRLLTMSQEQLAVLSQEMTA